MRINHCWGNLRNKTEYNSYIFVAESCMEFMKNYSTQKIVFLAYSTLLWTGSFVHIVAKAPLTQNLTTKTVSGTIEDAVIKTAVQSFNEVLAQKDGRPNRLSCTIQMRDYKVVSTVTKIYYSDYHQKPDCSIVSHSNEQPTQKFEVIYTTNNTSAFFVKTDGTKKQVPVPAGFSI